MCKKIQTKSVLRKKTDITKLRLYGELLSSINCTSEQNYGNTQDSHICHPITINKFHTLYNKLKVQ